MNSSMNSKEKGTGMPDRLMVFYQKNPCYEIVFSASFDGLWEELEKLSRLESGVYTSFPVPVVRREFLEEKAF